MDVELSCLCGAVHGWLENASPSTVHRVICFCDDCQASAHRLDRPDLLDAHGGSDAIQVSPSAVSFDRGTEQIACMRLTPKGKYHWYARCCRTPLGVTLKRAVPILPLPTALLRADPDVVCGKPRGALFGRYAIGGVPKELPAFGHVARFRYLLMVLRWKRFPNPFFDQKTGMMTHQ